MELGKCSQKEFKYLGGKFWILQTEEKLYSFIL